MSSRRPRGSESPPVVKRVRRLSVRSLGNRTEALGTVPQFRIHDLSRGMVM